MMEMPQWSFTHFRPCLLNTSNSVALYRVRCASATRSIDPAIHPEARSLK